MAHTRETRSFASEIKFVVDRALAPRLGEWARAHLSADPHGTGPFSDEYETASLYFETRACDVFHRRGSFGRAKYRVRRYGIAEYVFLERKLRRPGMLVKRRTAAPFAMLRRLNDPAVDPKWEGAWFHARLLARRLHPVCQVSYHRVARAIDLPEGPARLTLDTHLRAARVDAARYSASGGVPFLDDRAILELKFRQALPATFRRLVEDFALVPETASKYRLAMEALGTVRPAGMPALQGADASYA